MDPDASCATCAHWTELNRRERKGDRMGQCIAVACFTDFRIHGGLGCNECDPYAMGGPELLTAATFACQHYAERKKP